MSYRELKMVIKMPIFAWILRETVMGDFAGLPNS